MHGVLLTKRDARPGQRMAGLVARVALALRSASAFLIVVVVPTVLVAVYYLLIAANQYESSADFVVRHAEGTKSGAEVGQLLGFTLGNQAGESDAFAVQDYLLSHDAVARLQAENALASVFARPEADWLSRIWFDDGSPERLLKFYREHVGIRADDETGISHLEVRAFRATDAHAVAEKLLQLGEQQVNAINRRTFLDQVANAQRQYDDANRQLSTIENQLTAYRQSHADVDPADTGKAQVTLVTTLEQSLVAARARLKAMEGAINHASPQYQAMARQVETLQAQIDAQSSRIVGADHSVASRLGDYEQLVIKRQEIAQVYAVAAAQLKQAHAEAQRKQLYLIRVVEPNVPVRSEYPQRGQAILTVFAALVMAYAIGWLLWSGVREHAL